MIAQRESFIMNAEELGPIFYEHYEELSIHRRFGIPLQMDWDRYSTLELAGNLIFVVLRDDSDGALRPPIAGYFSGVLATGLHYRTCLTLHPDMFYIRRKYRNQGAGAFRLFRATERLAERLGVRCWQCTTKLGHPQGTKVLRAFGLVPTDMVLMKFYPPTPKAGG